MTESEVRAWLAENYNISQGETDCIMAQDGWRGLDAQTERYAGQAWDPGPESYAQANEFALSALVECHGGPHLPTCPSELTDLCWTQIRDEAEARDWVRRAVLVTGGGFHGDTPGVSYVNADGTPMLTPERAVMWDVRVAAAAGFVDVNAVALEFVV